MDVAGIMTAVMVRFSASTSIKRYARGIGISLNRYLYSTAKNSGMIILIDMDIFFRISLKSFLNKI